MNKPNPSDNRDDEVQLMERCVDRQNMIKAWKRVKKNGGSPGVDGMTIEERLRVAKLSDDFSAAIERGDRDAMLQILERVKFPAAGAAAFADEVLEYRRRSKV